jgi:hypothetical protein
MAHLGYRQVTPTIPEHTGYAEFVDDAGREDAKHAIAWLFFDRKYTNVD